MLWALRSEDRCSLHRSRGPLPRATSPYIVETSSQAIGSSRHLNDDEAVRCSANQDAVAEPKMSPPPVGGSCHNADSSLAPAGPAQMEEEGHGQSHSRCRRDADAQATLSALWPCADGGFGGRQREGRMSALRRLDPTRDGRQQEQHRQQATRGLISSRIQRLARGLAIRRWRAGTRHLFRTR